MSISEIANALGGDATKAQTAKLLSRFNIKIVPKKASETAVVLVLQKAALAKIASFSLARDVEPSVIMAAALQALANEPTILANLIDDDL